MLFNSLFFILLFLPLALLGFYSFAAIGHRWAAAWLSGTSEVGIGEECVPVRMLHL